MKSPGVFFQLSVRSVRLNFLRSILASIGIVIGVIAISSLGLLGANLQYVVKEQLSSNANTIIITSDVVRTTTTSGVPISSQGITKNQLSDIKSVAGVNNFVIPVHRTSTMFTVGSTDGRGLIYGLVPTDITKFLTIQEGLDIRGPNDALAGATLASTLGLKIGSPIKIGPSDETGRPVVRISGILAQRGFSLDGINTDNALVVSDSWFTDHYGNKDLYDQVNIIVQNVDTIPEVEAAINAKLNQRSQVVTIQDSSSRLSTISQTLGTITSFILAIGGISLVVAAVSIFNVMMMSVRERVQEIGILRSIGTERGEVRRMFLYEALILGLIGAGAGGLFSLVIGYAIVSSLIGNTAYFFLPDSIVYLPYGMVVGVIVCMVSGVYPAWQASNLDPIEALRNE